MPVWNFSYDGEEYLIEAKDFPEALRLWHDNFSDDQGENWPLSTHYLNDGPVLRKEEET